MKKAILIPSAVIALLIPTSFMLTGILSQKIIVSNIASLNQSNMANVSINKYDRGWFHSNINLHLVIKKPSDTKGSVYSIDFPVKLMHGPFYIDDKKIKFNLAGAYSKIDLPDEVQKTFTRVFSKNSTRPSIIFKIKVSYGGECNFSTNVPKFYLSKLDNTASLNWLGMINNIKASNGLKHVKGIFNLAGFEFYKNKSSMILKDIAGEYKFDRSSSGLYLGNAKLTINSVVSKENEKTIVNLTGLQIVSDNGSRNGLFYSDFNLNLDNLATNGDAFRKAVLEFKIKNLNEAVLAKINKKLDDIQNAKSDDEKQQIIFSMLPNMPALLKNGAELTIPKLSMNLVDGILSGNLSITIPSSEKLNWYEILQKTGGSLYLKIPKNSLDKYLNIALQPNNADEKNMPHDRISEIVNAGGLVIQDNFYILDLKLNSGNFIVNGKPASPELLKLL